MIAIRRMAFLLISLSAALLAQTSGAASMSGQTIFGTTDDPRIEQCGIRVTGDEWVELTPFIQTAQNFDGSFDVGVTKTSKSGKSQTRQSNVIKAGVLSATRIRLDRPAHVEIQMNIKDAAGKTVCRLAETIDIPASATRL